MHAPVLGISDVGNSNLQYNILEGVVVQVVLSIQNLCYVEFTLPLIKYLSV